MKDLLARYGALLLLILIQVDLAGQITDTITLHWDTLPRPQKGIFTRYHQKADTLFGFYPEALEVWQSTNQGQSWSLYQDSMQEFVATDSFIYYQKFGTQKYEARDNAGGVSVLAPVYTSTLLYQYNGESYYQVTAMRPLIGIDEHVVATFSTTRRDRCGTRCYTEMVAYRILRLSTNAGVDFQTFYLPITDADAYSTPQLALNGDSLAILDKGHLYLVPKNGLDMSAVSSVADSLFYFYQVTWIGNCLTVWGGDGSMYPQSQFPRKRSFDRGLTWTLDTLPVQMNRTQITTRDTFTFLAAPTGLYRSVNAHADSFVRIYTGLPGANSYVQSVLPRLPNIYANSSNNMLLHSNDGGQSWVLRPVPGIDDQMGIPFALDDKLNLINNFSWYQWSDDSAAWHVQPMQWPSIPDFPNPVLRLGGFLWIGGYKSNVFRSSDAGMSWQAISISPAVANQWVKLSITNNTLLADVGNTLWMSKDTGATWQILEGNDIEPWQVIRLGDSIVCLNRWQPKYVFRTLDLGQTYQAILQTELVIVSLHQLSGDKLVAVLEDGTTYLSKDFGESWIQTTQPQPPTAYASYSTVVDSLLFYQHSAWNAPLLVSANGGVTYTAFHTPTNLAGLYKLNGYLYFVNHQHLSRTPFDSLHQVVLAKNGKTGTLKGRIFFDNDMDCQLDSSDLPIAGKILEITPGPRFASTDPDGYFAVQLPIGTWAVKVPPLRHHTVCPDTLVANIVIPDDSVRTQDFGFQAVPNIYDGSVSLTPFTPVRPGFALRLPTLATIQAALRPLGTTMASFALLLAIGLAWWRRFGDEGASASQRRFATALVLLGSSFLLNASYHPLHELWAGGLIALALGLHRPGKWTAALAVAALALAIRELVLPFVLLMGASAAWRRDWRETSAWCALIAGFAVLLAWHHGVVAGYQQAGDLPGPSWLALRGVEGWIGNVIQSSQLHLLPGPIAMLVPVLALLGWASRRTPAGITASLLLLGYGLAFMIAGRENNFYWGLIVTPILFAGLAFVPAALGNLLQGGDRSIRPA